MHAVFCNALYFLPERIGCVGVVIVGGKSAVEFRLGEPEIIHTTGT